MLILQLLWRLFRKQVDWRILKHFPQYLMMKISERAFVEETAKYLKFTPNFVYPTPQDVIENIDRLIEVQEQPFRSLSVLSQYLIYSHVSQNSLIKVLLNGQVQTGFYWL